MPSELRLEYSEKLNRIQNCSIMGLKTWGQEEQAPTAPWIHTGLPPSQF